MLFNQAKKLFGYVIAIVALVGLSGQSLADDPSGKEDFYYHRFEIGLGAHLLDGKTVVRADAPDGSFGTTLNLEDDLSVDDREAVPYFLFRWNFTQRSSLNFIYFKLDRDGQQKLVGEVKYEDTTFAIDTVVDSFFDTEIYAAMYSYDFFRTKKDSLGFTMGLHWMTFSTGITETTTKTSETTSFYAPLPLFGLNYKRKLAEKWRLGLSGTYFSVEINDYEGEMKNFSIAARYQFSDHWNLNFGYTHFDLNGKGDIGSFDGRLDYTYDGPFLGFTYGF